MAEIRTTSSTGGQKGVKSQAYDKLPPIGLRELAVLYGVGARKYNRQNWSRGYEFSKSFAALQRHISLFWAGEDYDLELNSIHLSNAAWHCVTLYTLSYMHPEFDDRISSAGLDITPGMKTNIETVYPAVNVDLEASLREKGEDEPRFDLIPSAVLAELATLYGTGRISPVTEGVLWSDFYTKAQEHLWLFWGGETFNKNGEHHILYALHYILCMVELFCRFEAFDDRFKESLGGQPIGFNSAPDK